MFTNKKFNNGSIVIVTRYIHNINNYTKVLIESTEENQWEILYFFYILGSCEKTFLV